MQAQGIELKIGQLGGYMGWELGPPMLSSFGHLAAKLCLYRKDSLEESFQGKLRPPREKTLKILIVKSSQISGKSDDSL